MEQLATIKRAPHEYMVDFNYKFQKTWDKIPLLVKPSLNTAFIHYLKSLNPDIAIMIQSMGGTVLLDAYDIAIKAENCLIQAGKIAPRPPMPLFLEAPVIQPVVAPIPTTTSIGPLITPTVEKEDERDALIRKLSNELVLARRQPTQQNAQSRRLYQPTQQTYQPFN